jgi:ADP-ribosyl-[dinitrogen reductase] hydrolase
LTTGSFEDALVQVINLGDDADTVGTVTGMLAGAAYGLAAIPPRWRAELHGAWPIHSRTFWRDPDFVRLADRLVMRS